MFTNQVLFCKVSPAKIYEKRASKHFPSLLLLNSRLPILCVCVFVSVYWYRVIINMGRHWLGENNNTCSQLIYWPIQNVCCWRRCFGSDNLLNKIWWQRKLWVVKLGEECFLNFYLFQRSAGKWLIWRTLSAFNPYSGSRNDSRTNTRSHWLIVATIVLLAGYLIYTFQIISPKYETKPALLRFAY